MHLDRPKITPIALACLCVTLLGCTTSEKIGDFGDIELYSFYARVSGAPALTGIVKVDKNTCHAEVCTVFAQTDLASIGLQGVLGMGSSALNGMTFGMFRRPDKFEQNINVGGGSSSGGGGGASGSSVGDVTITNATANNSSSTTSSAASTAN